MQKSGSDLNCFRMLTENFAMWSLHESNFSYATFFCIDLCLEEINWTKKVLSQLPSLASRLGIKVAFQNVSSILKCLLINWFLDGFFTYESAEWLIVLCSSMNLLSAVFMVFLLCSH